MNYTSLIQDIRRALPAMDLREQEPLSRHCSFRIGGPAAWLALPNSEEELIQLCQLLVRKGEEPFLMGNGTNMLFPDAGLDRLVIKTCQNVGGVSVAGNVVTAQCGASLARVATAAMEAGLTGLEFAHGIPGSVGGGVVMNAGAYGGELKDVVAETTYLDEHMTVSVLRGAEHEFSYRHSYLSDHTGVVLSVKLVLTSGDRETIAGTMRALAEKRRASQPLDMPSAGSTFKRPAVGYAAALIDEAGLKGYTVGGAQVSTKHAGFVVNTGGACCEDVLRLMEHIQNTVLARSGVLLEPEVRIIRG